MKREFPSNNFAKEAYDSEPLTKELIDSGKFSLIELAIYYHVTHMLELPTGNVNDDEKELSVVCASVSEARGQEPDSVRKAFDKVLFAKQGLWPA
jgi:hypothetical protein